MKKVIFVIWDMCNALDLYEIEPEIAKKSTLYVQGKPLTFTLIV